MKCFARQSMHLLVVLPRRSPVGRDIPNSVDLCVHDLVAASRHRDTTCIVAEHVHDLFSEFETADVPPIFANHTALLAHHAARVARRRGADLIVVHQHFQIAARLARMLPKRVVFHAHGFYKRYSSGHLHSLRRQLRLRELNRLAGLVHVSEACCAHFACAWPEVSLPQAVVYNGFDFGQWTPTRPKQSEILCVGRCVPEKGILEAAQAVARVLAERPEWRARFSLSEPERDPAYLQKVQGAITAAAVSDRVTIELNVPWRGIKDRFEQAAIALVPSRWREPFGRTALEAHAGGAALISSGSGGLREVSGLHALFVDPADIDGFANAIRRLIDDEDLRRSLSDGGARYVRERFSIEAVAAAYDAYLEEVWVKLSKRSKCRAD